MMTKIEAYKAVVAGEMTDEVIAKFEELIAAYEAEAAKRKERAAVKRAEKLEAEKGLETAVYEFLGEEAVSASQIMEAVEGLTSVQKATSIAKRLVEAGMAEQVELKVKGRKIKGYTRV
jgi:VIT1/CCC1 family predicted Fe2+/Mn2+ transporter